MGLQRAGQGCLGERRRTLWRCGCPGLALCDEEGRLPLPPGGPNARFRIILNSNSKLDSCSGPQGVPAERRGPSPPKADLCGVISQRGLPCLHRKHICPYHSENGSRRAKGLKRPREEASPNLPPLQSGDPDSSANPPTAPVSPSDDDHPGAPSWKVTVPPKHTRRAVAVQWLCSGFVVVSAGLDVLRWLGLTSQYDGRRFADRAGATCPAQGSEIP